MLPTLLLPDANVLQLDLLTVDEHKITVTMTALQTAAECPTCTHRSCRVHSHYRRTVADLPWAGVPVQLQLQVRKFFCRNEACAQSIFTERLPTIVAPWARRSLRLTTQQRQLGLALGGQAGARAGQCLGLPASRDTLLRLVRRGAVPARPTPRVLGVDDWARQKGQTYGTLLVDLETHEPVDVLPDRTADTFAHWLQAHPGVEIISRDRSGAYAEGGATGAPDAVQVADRWHLLKNLGDALTSLFDQHRAAIEQHWRPATPPSDAPQKLIDPTVHPLTGAAIPAVEQEALTAAPTRPMLLSLPARVSKRKQEEQEQRRARRRARYETVRQLHDQGWTVSAIAEQVGLDRNTVYKYVQAATFPERQPRSPQASLLDPFKPYLLQRWNAGCHTGTVLLREVKARGYRGSSSTFLAYITQLRQAAGLPPKKRTGRQANSISDPTQRLASSRALTWLVLCKAETLDETDRVRLEWLCAAHANLATAITLAQEFATIVRTRQPERLDPWLDRTEQSEIAPLVSFVKGIRRDYAAVRAGVTLPYSNGPTEGQINRLKLLKRQMFGRAKLDLLKQRLMAT